MRLIAGALLVSALGRAARGEELWPDLSSPPSAGAGTSGAKDAAVVIGIEEYAFVESIPGARRNADDWQAYLTTTRAIPFDRVGLLRDGEATAEQIRRFAEQKAAEVEPGGTLWFVFIGHGAPSHDGEDGLIVGADARASVESLSARSLSRRELIEILSKGRQARTVMLIDACFSGRTPSGEALAPGLQPLVNVANAAPWADKRTVLMAAARSDEYAGSLPKTARLRPAFSYLALGAMLGWGAEKDGTVTAGGVVRFAQRALKLAKDRTQTPELAAGDPKTVIGAGRARVPDLARIDREGRAAPGRPPMEWVSIPGGSFMMGDALGTSESGVLHRVAIKSFEIARTLVTVDQYQACVDAGACPKAEGCAAFSLKADPPVGDQPIVCVSWNQARTFSEWIGGRLPSEAEWEYAARGGGQDRIYPWGVGPPTCELVVMHDQAAGLPACGRNEPWPVCSKRNGDTPQGVCDMAGDAKQWVQDYYHKTYVGAPVDGSAWESPTSIWRVVRGAGWDDSSIESFLTTARGVGTQDGRYPTVGFRPARDIPTR